jgi:hypothetical protein
MKTETEQINELRSKREANIVELLHKGFTYQKTAEIVGVAISTVFSIAAKHGMKRTALPPIPKACRTCDEYLDMSMTVCGKCPHRLSTLRPEVDE